MSSRIRAIIIAATFLVAGMETAAAGPTPGSYSYYTWPTGSQLDSVDFATTVRVDPGKFGQVFWSHQFNFTDGGTAYTGMQSNANSPRTFLFSVWDATEAKAGSAGSFCVTFGGEGKGKSCRYHYYWKEGHTFRFHVAHEGNDWFGVTVTDVTGNTSFKLGSIRAKSKYIATDQMNDWTEYFEWNFDTATCFNQPYSRAEFGLPTAKGGALVARHGTTERSKTCTAYSRIDATPGGFVQSNAIGNSLRAPIVSGSGICLDAQGGVATNIPAITYGCTSRDNQAWVLGVNGGIALTDNSCLAVAVPTPRAGARVFVLPCSDTTAQRWNYTGDEIRLRASSLCLTAHASPAQLTVQACTQSGNQRWKVALPPA